MAPTHPSWEVATLRGLGIQPNNTNTLALLLWAKSEGNTRGRGYNWLNMTTPAPGATTFNTTGVKNYVSFTQGVATLVSTLKSPMYANITKTLAHAKDTPTPTSPNLLVSKPSLAMIWTAINKSPWCKGCQTGKYPVALYKGQAGTTAGGTYPDTLLAGGGTTDRCVWKLGPGLCVLNASQARALKGGLLVTAGGVVAFVGLAILAAYGFEKKGPLGQVTRAARAAGIGGPGAQTGAQRRAQAEADAQERHATPAQRAGTPTPAGERLRAQEEPRRSGRDYAPFTEADTTSRLRQRTAERRPHSRQHQARSRA